jgi:hypothetical protein
MFTELWLAIWGVEGVGFLASELTARAPKATTAIAKARTKNFMTFSHLCEKIFGLGLAP